MAQETALQRRFKLDVNTGTIAVPVWSQVVGLIELNPTVEPTDQDDFDYDSNGWKGSTRTMRMWDLEFKISYKQDSVTFVANPTHTYLRNASNALGAASVVHVRWYDRNGAAEAYEGFGLVKWTPDGGDAEQLNQVSIAVTPSATSPELVEITNPLNTSPVPLITGLSPDSGASAGGNLVEITGAYFNGATDVDFGANPATEFDVVSASTIVAIAPAGTGTVDVIVTTPNGSNANTAADDYTYV